MTDEENSDHRRWLKENKAREDKEKLTQISDAVRAPQETEDEAALQRSHRELAEAEIAELQADGRITGEQAREVLEKLFGHLDD
jgi:formiminotetrahydrofolate cyclodeaminase